MMHSFVVYVVFLGTLVPCPTFGLHHLFIYNDCEFPIWIGNKPNVGSTLFNNGGFVLLDPGTMNDTVVSSLYIWSGQVWARTNCDSTGHCQTGDCGGKIECAGSGPTGPTTVVQFSFNGLYGKNEYEVSLIDGFNLPIQVTPRAGNADNAEEDYYYCTKAGCKTDLNKYCPVDLAVRDGANVIACKSPCQAHSTDEYCCRGFYSQARRCKTTEWPVDYVSVFKGSCPDAKIYKYDSSTSPFWCRPNVDVDFDVHFCPK